MDWQEVTAIAIAAACAVWAVARIARPFFGKGGSACGDSGCGSAAGAPPEPRSDSESDGEAELVQIEPPKTS